MSGFSLRLIELAGVFCHEREFSDSDGIFASLRHYQQDLASLGDL